LRDGTDVVVASDYSGEHKSVGFYAFSFVFVDWNASEQWSIASSTVRDKYLAVNNREMAYKKLGDAHKQAALIPFLAAADQIPGLAITLLVSKRVDSVLEPGGVNYLRQLVPALTNWQDSTLEKLYRVESFLAFLLAGLCRSQQTIATLTDQESHMLDL
jgi:hypothetical protein